MESYCGSREEGWRMAVQSEGITAVATESLPDTTESNAPRAELGGM